MSRAKRWKAALLARRKIAWERDRGICALCNAKPDADGKGWDADHRVPLSEGGPDVAENIRTLCVPCHKRETRVLMRRLRDGELPAHLWEGVTDPEEIAWRALAYTHHRMLWNLDKLYEKAQPQWAIFGINEAYQAVHREVSLRVWARTNRENELRNEAWKLKSQIEQRRRA